MRFACAEFNNPIPQSLEPTLTPLASNSPVDTTAIAIDSPLVEVALTVRLSESIAFPADIKIVAAAKFSPL